MYSMKKARKEYAKRYGEPLMDKVLQAVKATPGAWGRLFKLQKENIFPKTKEKEDENAV